MTPKEAAIQILHSLREKRGGNLTEDDQDDLDFAIGIFSQVLRLACRTLSSRGAALSDAALLFFLSQPPHSSGRTWATRCRLLYHRTGTMRSHRGSATHTHMPPGRCLTPFKKKTPPRDRYLCLLHGCNCRAFMGRRTTMTTSKEAASERRGSLCPDEDCFG